MMRGRCVSLMASVAIAAVWVTGSGSAFGERPGRFTEIVDGAPIITVLPKDAISAIDAPMFVLAKEADRVMQPDEPVLGVTDGKVAKAYSLWQLNHHEIVNDRIGSVPLAVTW